MTFYSCALMEKERVFVPFIKKRILMMPCWTKFVLDCYFGYGERISSTSEPFPFLDSGKELILVQIAFSLIFECINQVSQLFKLRDVGASCASWKL